MKAYTAAPPDVLRVDEKNLREYSIPNVCGVIITSNHKTNGIHLPADDRRHYLVKSHQRGFLGRLLASALWLVRSGGHRTRSGLPHRSRPLQLRPQGAAT